MPCPAARPCPVCPAQFAPVRLALRMSNPCADHSASCSVVDAPPVINRGSIDRSVRSTTTPDLLTVFVQCRRPGHSPCRSTSHPVCVLCLHLPRSVITHDTTCCASIPRMWPGTGKKPYPVLACCCSPAPLHDDAAWTTHPPATRHDTPAGRKRSMPCQQTSPSSKTRPKHTTHLQAECLAGTRLPVVSRLNQGPSVAPMPPPTMDA